MAKQGWHRFAMPIGPSFGMFKVELHLEATGTERDDPLTSAFVEDMLHLSLKSTKELVSHLIVVDKLLAYSPKADVIMIYGPYSANSLIHDSVGFYSSKATITFQEHQLDRHLLSLAIEQFLQVSLVSSHLDSPIFRVKNVFILADYSKPIEPGARNPAFSVEMATNVDYTNRIIVDLKFLPQSVSYRPLTVSFKYDLAEEEEPMRCVVLPSLRTAMIKSVSERVPEEEINRTSFYDFVDHYKNHHQMHLDESVEEKGYAVIVVNTSSDPDRFLSHIEEIVPVGTLWTETGLSRRDISGTSAEVLTSYILQLIGSIKCGSVRPMTKDTDDASPLLVRLPAGAFDDVTTTSTDALIEIHKELKSKRPGFTKSSTRSTPSIEGEIVNLDTSTSTDTAPSGSQPTTQSSVKPSQLEEDAFEAYYDNIQQAEAAPTLAEVLEALKSTSSMSSSTAVKPENRKVVIGATIGLRKKFVPDKAALYAPFKKVVPTKLPPPSAAPESSSTPSSPSSSLNDKKRKESPLAKRSSVHQPFKPPTQKKPKLAE